MFKTYENFKKATHNAHMVLKANPKLKHSEFRDIFIQNSEFKNTHALKSFFDKKSITNEISAIELLTEHKFYSVGDTLKNSNDTSVSFESNKITIEFYHAATQKKVIYNTDGVQAKKIGKNKYEIYDLNSLLNNNALQYGHSLFISPILERSILFSSISCTFLNLKINF